MVYTSVAFLVSFILSTFVSSWRWRIFLALPPALVSYTLLFRLNQAAQADFEQRIWHSERMRGLKAGSDVDGDGKISGEERIKESAEWANAVLRGIWPVMNPELWVYAS